jgi:TetR/AcrR family transcriptional regulator, cholesterol catabolism regulator
MTRHRSAEQPMPAIPRTPLQMDRRNRVLAVSTALLTSGGEDALQMKTVADAAEVSLATLYRYFPSKDHILLAMANERFERALEKPLRSRHLPTATERVCDHLLREFRAQQREPRVTAALVRVLSYSDPTYSVAYDYLQGLHLALIAKVAQGDDESLAPAQRAVLSIVTGMFGAATRGWIAGVRTAADARFEIRIACRLLDLPAEVIDADRSAAVTS